MTTTEEQKSIEVPAYSVSDVNQWGCPHCGYRSGSMPMSAGGAATWRCGDCGKMTFVLADGLSAIPATWRSHHGNRCPHPRQGTPAHGRPDKRPEEGGEFFHPRGVGMDVVPACFACGQELSGYVNNIAAFVQCKEAGERVVALFDDRARLDYRDFEPDRIQVKIGCCEQHQPELEDLNTRTGTTGRIDRETIESVRRGERAVLRYEILKRKRGVESDPWTTVVSTLNVEEATAAFKGLDDNEWDRNSKRSIDHIEPRR